MGNNTRIETAEEAANRLRFVIGSGVSNVNSFVEGANWQKQQDEAKYKELLDSHNELLEAAIKAVNIFKRLADEGRYPEFMLQQNGALMQKYIKQVVQKCLVTI